VRGTGCADCGGRATTGRTFADIDKRCLRHPALDSAARFIDALPAIAEPLDNLVILRADHIWRIHVASGREGFELLVAQHSYGLHRVRKLLQGFDDAFERNHAWIILSDASIRKDACSTLA